MEKFKRKAFDSLKEWKDNYAPNYAALLEGARRVGKSTIAEEFAKKNYRSYLKIDFANINGDLLSAFDDIAKLDIFFLRLQTITGINLYPRESVIIFDEIQLYPKARQAIKYLVADGRYDYIETGSLISIKKNVKDIVIPSEEYKIPVYPMDYEEFMWAIGNSTYDVLRQLYKTNAPAGNGANRSLMRDFRIYMAVGGMPQAVQAYVDGKNFSFIENGSTTSTPGFKAAGVTAGFKRSGAPDFALLFSEVPANAAGVFTTCRFAAAPVRYCKEILAKGGKLQAVSVNSGIANACTGKPGLEASRKTAALAAAKLGIAPDAVAVASTGRIGVQMDMALIEKALDLAVPQLSSDGGNDAARAIMTTDTVPKAVAAKLEINGKTVTIGAMTKGAGMINPGMAGLHATMLCFITTDADIDKDVLAGMLEENAQNSFNRITVDGDMSTNDTVLIFANGVSGVKIAAGTQDEADFKAALLEVMKNLAHRMVKDGEGSTKLVTIEVVNARSVEDAKKAAESVANSLLCKTAWFGNDPNWGRIAAALGYSGAVFDPDKCDISIDGVPVMTQGGDAGTPESVAAEVVKKDEFTIRCDFNDGDSNYWVWSSDVSYEYVKINADYHT